MKHPKAKRDWEIRQLLRATLGRQLKDAGGGLGIERPKIDFRQRQLTVSTKGRYVVNFGDPPPGVVFRDGSFLTIHEVWSEQGELIYFSYPYQIPDPARWRFFRYDRELPDPPPVDKPRHHLHVGGELHFATGPVKLDAVMNVIAELFKRQAGGQEAL
jgi:hypothetical protein